MTSGESSVPSKTQLDRLGERLRLGTSDEDDLRRLDDYRRSFRPQYEAVASAIREHLKLEATGRPAKTTSAITDKLRRQSIRLTQIQDIAGLRVIVNDLDAQDQVLRDLLSSFAAAVVDDRRKRPSHGYRAVHVIIAKEGKQVEVQVRTTPQHLWAELSEKMADTIDARLKYGGGPRVFRQRLSRLSRLVAKIEMLEREFAELLKSSIGIRVEYESAVPSERNPKALRQAQKLEEGVLVDQARLRTEKGKLALLLKNLLVVVEEQNEEGT